jgi:hypothetical protein
LTNRELIRRKFRFEEHKAKAMSGDVLNNLSDDEDVELIESSTVFLVKFNNSFKVSCREVS